MKFKVTGYQTFDTYPDGTFDYQTFETEEKAKDYVKKNRHREGSVQGRYKVYRYYSIQEIRE